MALPKPRSQIIHPTETISLIANFFDGYGELADPISFPSVQIIEPSGNIIVGPTSAGVYRLSIGEYGFDYQIPLAGAQGVYSDVWRGSFANNQISVREYNFVVYYSQMPQINNDGYLALGDDVGFNYSQNAILNINKLLKGLRARLKSSGKSAGKDQFGNPIYVDCDIYSVDQLVTFLAQSLSMFNEVPHFTSFDFNHSEIIKVFYDVLVQGAVLLALSSQALIERGREYQISDGGISLTPPSISELLNSQWSTELSNHFEKVKLIKASMKPKPIGLGTLSGSISRAPQLARLRWLRARQII
jgi:hypothetical protein